MDATITKLPLRQVGRGSGIARPSREEAEEAVGTLIACRRRSGAGARHQSA
jgi:hypothetical protein